MNTMGTMVGVRNECTIYAGLTCVNLPIDYAHVEYVELSMSFWSKRNLNKDGVKFGSQFRILIKAPFVGITAFAILGCFVIFYSRLLVPSPIAGIGQWKKSFSRLIINIYDVENSFSR